MPIGCPSISDPPNPHGLEWTENPLPPALSRISVDAGMRPGDHGKEGVRGSTPEEAPLRPTVGLPGTSASVGSSDSIHVPGNVLVEAAAALWYVLEPPLPKGCALASNPKPGMARTGPRSGA